MRSWTGFIDEVVGLRRRNDDAVPLDGVRRPLLEGAPRRAPARAGGAGWGALSSLVLSTVCLAERAGKKPRARPASASRAPARLGNRC